VPLSRRSLLRLIGAGVVTAGLAVAGVLYEDAGLRYKVEEHLGLHPGPDLALPESGARLVTGAFESRVMKAEVGYAYSLPPKGDPGAIVLSLYGKGGDQTTVFDWLHLPDAAAYVGAPLAIASANGGTDNYWHRRANGTDAHAMLVDELVPLLVERLGRLPLVLYGFSMGGYGALLAAERGAGANGENLFRAVAAASPALWTEPGETAPGAFDSPADFYANDVFSSVQRLRSLRVRLDCGEEDPFYSATRELSALMAWPHEAVYRPGAAHTAGYWRSGGTISDALPGGCLRLGPLQLIDFRKRQSSSAK
jgi:pimeloyl-ACP methyl ester carboxylesterase